MRTIWDRTGVTKMRKYLYHVIKTRTKLGNLKYSVRKCTVESYELRLKTHGDDGMYFETEDKAIEVRDKLIEQASLYGDDLVAQTTNEKRIGWVQLCLNGTKSDIEKVFVELEEKFVVAFVSNPYANGHNDTVRVYCKICRNGEGAAQ